MRIYYLIALELESDLFEVQTYERTRGSLTPPSGTIQQLSTNSYGGKLYA